MKTENTNKKRRSYDRAANRAAFKSNILKMNEDGRSISSLAESFGIKENLIYRWKSLARASSEQTDSFAEGEVKRLRSELKETRQERDILKKALGIFSRHP